MVNTVLFTRSTTYFSFHDLFDLSSIQLWKLVALKIYFWKNIRIVFQLMFVTGKNFDNERKFKWPLMTLWSNVGQHSTNILKKRSAKNMAQNCNFLSKKYFDLKSRFDELLNFSPIKVNFENFRPKTVIFGFFCQLLKSHLLYQNCWVRTQIGQFWPTLFILVKS